MSASTNFIVNIPFAEPVRVKKNPSITCQELIKEICTTIGINEYIWFGLEFTDLDGERTNMLITDSLEKCPVNLDKPETNVVLKVLYYPFSHNQVYQQRVKQIMMKQALENVASGSVYSPPEITLNLVAHFLQAEKGDLDNMDAATSSSVIAEAVEKYVPKQMKSRHGVDQNTWEDTIRQFWATLQCYHTFDAVEGFLDLMEGLQMHNVHHHSISNTKGTKLSVGIEASGISIYDREDLQTPTVSFAWADLQNFNLGKNSMSLKLRQEKSSIAEEDLNFQLSSQIQGLRILSSVRGYFLNYKNYLSENNIPQAYLNMKQAAMESQKIDQLKRGKDIAGNMAKIIKVCEIGIEKAKKVDDKTAKRVQNIVSKIKSSVDLNTIDVSSVTCREKALEIYSQMNQITKCLSKNVSNETTKTLRQSRSKSTKEDEVYEEQEKKCVNKQGTLTALRTGNTKIRVAQFENM